MLFDDVFCLSLSLLVGDCWLLSFCVAVVVSWRCLVLLLLVLLLLFSVVRCCCCLGVVVCCCLMTMSACVVELVC